MYVRLQAGWSEHKKVHQTSGAWLYCRRRGQDFSPQFPDFKWTGPLRPDRVGPPRLGRFQRAFKGQIIQKEGYQRVRFEAGSKTQVLAVQHGLRKQQNDPAYIYTHLIALMYQFDAHQ
eukprot:evm.model.scf_63.11 EVM.evm.TU.scf_63.11   scf_63:93597-94787(+)